MQNISALEVPQGSGRHVLSGSSLWLAGLNANGGLHTSAGLYGSFVSSARDFFPGPLRSDGSASTTPAISAAFDQVWVVKRQQIAEHLAYFDCLSDPGCDMSVAFPNGYAIPPAIMQWPAMGDVANGFDLNLAPYFDYDADGTYDPQAGDAPCILGDQAYFLVFNDNLAPHTLSMGAAMGLEVQVMGFVYDREATALDQTVFLRFHLINRSTITYSDVHIGYYSDIDIGCGNDDFVGTDPYRNMLYFYNWQNIDVDCLGALGYGLQPPAVGLAMIKGPLLDANGTDESNGNAIPAWNGEGFGDGIPDNERHGLSYSLSFNRESPNSAMTDPSTSVQFAQYLKSIWKDGVAMSHGGSGYSIAPDAVPTRFAFTGVDDPVHAGTNGVVVPPWSETVPTPTTPDRRGVMSSGPITLDPGEHVDLLFAYVYARAVSGGAIASVAALQARVDSIHDFAQTLPIWNVPENQPYAGMCADYATIGIRERSAAGTLVLFPSPAADVAQFISPMQLAGGLLTLCDATGRVVMQQRVLPDRNTIDVSALAKGVYVCEAVARNARFTGRIVKE